MLIYDPVRLMNFLVREEVRKWYRYGLLEKESAVALMAIYAPAYKKHHWLYRTGVFLLTTVVLWCSMGLFGLFFRIYDNPAGVNFFLLFYAAVTLGSLSFYVRNNHHYKSGVVESLLYNGILLLVSAVVLIIEPGSENIVLVVAAVALPCLVAGAILFTERLLALAAFVAWTALVFSLALKAGDAGRLLLPFILMITAAAVYFPVHKKACDPKLLFWKPSLEMVEIAALVLFYAAGNYFIVREGSVLLMNMEIVPGSDIPFAWLFYAFTVCVPLVYLYGGYRRRDMKLLNAGLLFIAVSALTFRYYYHVLSPELALIAAGMLLISAAGLALRYFKTDKAGFTLREDRYRNPVLRVTAEALIAAQTLTPQGMPAREQGTPFGGGEFGGGGAGSNY